MILQINKFYTNVIGGIETTVKYYSEYLNNYEKVTVLCIKKHFSLKTSITEINGVTVYFCSSFGTFFSMPLSISFFYYFYKLARRSRIIHLHEPFPLGTIACIIFKNRNNKIFITWHSDIIKQRLLKNVVQLLQHKLCNLSDLIFTTSDHLLHSSSVLSRVKKDIIVLPSSIDADKYLLFNSPLSIYFDNIHENYVLFIGRLCYYKGIDILLDSLQFINPDIPIVIVGKGELENFVLDRIKSYNNVLFINRFVSDSEKKALLKNCKFLVFPSTQPSEAFGLVQLEAMIYSKPVINTNLPTGVPWVSVNGISGLTVNVGDSKSLAHAINLLYFDKVLYDKLSQGAFNRCMNMFTNQVIFDKLFKFYFS